MDRFLLAENPMQPPDGRPLYIIHTVDPPMIIEVHHEAFGTGDMMLTVNYQGSTGLIETITLNVKALLICDQEVTPELRTRVDKVLNKAWYWYKAYLEWEDDNFDEDEKSKQN